MKDHIKFVRDLYAPLPTDSHMVRRSKAEIAALLAGKNQFEFEGKTHNCQTREQAMHSLGLNARYSATKSYAERRG